MLVRVSDCAGNCNRLGRGIWLYRRVLTCHLVVLILLSIFVFQSSHPKMATKLNEPIRVVITGAAGQIAYSLLYHLGKGDVFGENQPMYLHLLDIPPMMGVLDGVVMEMVDCALPLVLGVVPTTDLSVAFTDADAAFLLGSMPRKQGMERRDLLSANCKIFREQGEAINKYAKKEIKVLVVGNPANTNAFVCAKYAPNVPKENFTAMTRLDQNRALALLASKLGVSVREVKNAIIWGNHSSTQYPDANNATVTINGVDKSVAEVLKNDAWLRGEFVTTVQNRGGAVIAARKMSSAMSAAKAAADHMRDVWHGTKPGTFVSMAVISDGSYGVPKDLVFSFPVTITNRKWTIVKGLKIDQFSQEKLNLTTSELEDEKKAALDVCAD